MDPCALSGFFVFRAVAVLFFIIVLMATASTFVIPSSFFWSAVRFPLSFLQGRDIFFASLTPFGERFLLFFFSFFLRLTSKSIRHSPRFIASTFALLLEAFS